MVDIEKATSEELYARLLKNKESDIKEIKDKIEEIAKIYRVTEKDIGAELFPSVFSKSETEGKGKTRGRVQIKKYKNPDNPEQEWTGAGGKEKAPDWYKDQLEAGKEEEQLINPEWKEKKTTK